MISSLAKDKLLNFIESVFSDTEYPGDIELVKYPTGYEYADVYQHFRGKVWQKFQSIDDLTYYQEDIEISFPVTCYMSYLRPASFIYYLPATMTMLINTCIDDPVGLEVEAILVSNLNPDYESFETFEFTKHLMNEKDIIKNKEEYKDHQKYYEKSSKARYCLLNNDQNIVVGEFLVYLIERYETSRYPHLYDEARYILNKHWKQFLSEKRQSELRDEGII